MANSHGNRAGRRHGHTGDDVRDRQDTATHPLLGGSHPVLVRAVHLARPLKDVEVQQADRVVATPHLEHAEARVQHGHVVQFMEAEAVNPPGGPEQPIALF
ncbi:hypothetical protein [Sphaerotilus sulfidivorans]|uniref:hypothetical protein n=1 Tax=Sphaerotilus sulfidivorans TaxID=639200 RepID=UPI002357B705|nr:hypothetical protein [Sphaerotilus sulfidivorans]